MQQHRQRGGAHHLVGYAAQNETAQATASVCFQGDQVGAHFLGHAQDGRAGLLRDEDLRKDGSLLVPQAADDLIEIALGLFALAFSLADGWIRPDPR